MLKKFPRNWSKIQSDKKHEREHKEKRLSPGGPTLITNRSSRKREHNNKYIEGNCQRNHSKKFLKLREFPVSRSKDPMLGKWMNIKPL